MPETECTVQIGGLSKLYNLDSIVLGENVKLEQNDSNPYYDVTSAEGNQLEKSGIKNAEVYTVSYGMFEECESLEYVTITGPQEAILVNSFLGCHALKEIVSP